MSSDGRKARAVKTLKGDGASFHVDVIVYKGMVYAKMFYEGMVLFSWGWHPPSTRVLAERTKIQHSHNFCVVFIALFAIFLLFSALLRTSHVVYACFSFKNFLTAQFFRI